MAANIDQSTGVAAVFVTGEPAWHRLGTVIEKAATSAEAIKLAGLDWTVEQWPLQASHPVGQKFGGRTVAVPNRVANVRTDTDAVLGVVSTTYHVFQNVEAFDFMDALVGDKLAMYETAGALDNGKRVWMSARVPGEFIVFGAFLSNGKNLTGTRATWLEAAEAVATAIEPLHPKHHPEVEVGRD